jgi:hypothetical protein
VAIPVVAQLALLVAQPSSPLYARGGDPAGLPDVISDCLERVVAR